MEPNIKHPAVGEKSFSCPHCEALAHQNWYRLFADIYEGETRPRVPGADAIKEVRRGGLDAHEQALIAFYLEKRLQGFPFFEVHTNSTYLKSQLDNCWASRCYSCGNISLWVFDALVYPSKKYSYAPNPETPDEIKRDFIEAATIIDLSSRGAAALLRLCIQKLVIVLGETGDNLNNDIGNLVEKRVISKAIQKALDIVRVVGNNAVHPGVIDFNDNKATAHQLFKLVNVIVESTIATPKHIDAIYEEVVPETTRKAIEARDNKPIAIEKPSSPEG